MVRIMLKRLKRRLNRRINKRSGRGIRNRIRTKISGFLTREDLETLEEASRRKPKYEKKFTQAFNCIVCNYKWFYKTIKCPACESIDVRQA